MIVRAGQNSTVLSFERGASLDETTRIGLDIFNFIRENPRFSAKRRSAFKLLKQMMEQSTVEFDRTPYFERGSSLRGNGADFCFFDSRLFAPFSRTKFAAH